MTDTELIYTPSDLGFSHPLNYILVSRATPYIVNNLNNLMWEYDDSETRWEDSTRTHERMVHSQWFAFYRRNQVVITNRLPSEQFRYLSKGNGFGTICAKHNTRRWNEKTRRFSKLTQGALRFYDKRDGMWKYRSCVKPIGSGIIKTFNSGIQRAVFQGLEQARWEIDYEFDMSQSSVGVSHDLSAATPTDTIEEIAAQEMGMSRIDKREEEVVADKSSILSRVKAATEKAMRKTIEGGSSLIGKFRRR